MWLNTELLVLHRFDYLSRRVGLECFMLPVNWFTRAIRLNHTHLAAAGQVEIERVSGNILWAMNLFQGDKIVASEILDCLSIEAGLRKLHFVTASLSKVSPMFETFIKCGYNPSSWETIWRFRDKHSKKVSSIFTWRKTRSSDLIRINFLQNKLLSSDEKKVSRPANLNNPKYVLLNKDVLIGYANMQTSGIKAVVTPVLDPQIPETANVINSFCRIFLNQIPNQYIVLSASQQWVTQHLQDQIELVHPRQEILVKQVAIRSTVHSSIFNRIPNGQQTDIATPLRQSNKQDNNI
jgi:hypothetical protein